MSIVIRQISGFLMVGGIAFLVDWGLLLLAAEVFGMGLIWGRVVSISLAILVTWWGNRTYSFHLSTPPSMKEFLQYLSTVMISIILNMIIFLTIIQLWPIASEQLLYALAPATVVSMIVNFSLMRKWPFRAT